MVCIIAVQVLNAADWSVILPITSDISDFLGLGGGAYGGWLVAALYLPFPLSLVVFRTIQSYRWGYLFWASSSVVGNLLDVLAHCMDREGMDALTGVNIATPGATGSFVRYITVQTFTYL